ncbi:hypothetical protein [Kitasatospora phosalacinea]|uniref:Uncharacterized protein n=1 Tax=Kitasatospora phosalacinea TaxID=2065 RepID=A0A9W6PKW1_9ACTN|nr:hypothetical protein [Kitasatospora phosalacinea]GLW56718.1 hypothetical protein Kpho01_47290 [Kitasatospora phosalacinea]
MDPGVTLLAATAGTLVTGVTAAWCKARVQVRRERELSRRQHLRELPAGSRIVDLGERGVLIEVGNRKGPARGHR